jgi:hypothetical protein
LKECEWKWNFEKESEMEKDLIRILEKYLILGEL